MAARLSWRRALILAGLGLGVGRVLAVGPEPLTLAGMGLLVAVALLRPGPRPWRQAYYCQTCGAVYPLRPPRRCACGCVRFFREDATPPTTS